MSHIAPLIALSAAIFATLTLLAALCYHPPRLVAFVDFSAWSYRQLLAAYPDTFQQEYGESMLQLFRDMARDAYRRRGVLGLVGLWLRTLADFTRSVIQQHREKPVVVSSESVLLHDLFRKWRRLIYELLAVTAFSAWYGFHLLRLYFRRAALVWATLTVISLGIWFTSFFDAMTLMRGRMFHVGIAGGVVQIWHHSEVGPPMSDEQWQRDTREWVKTHPDVPDRLGSPARPWEFSLVNDIPGGSVIQHGPPPIRKPLLIQPFQSSRLRFPFGILPALLMGWTIRVYLRRNTASVATMQSA